MVFAVIGCIVMIPISLLILGIDPIRFDELLIQYFFFGLYIFPVFVAIVAVTLLFFHPHSFQYAPMSGEGHHIAFLDHGAAINAAIGLLQAITQDITNAHILNRLLYSSIMLRSLDTELYRLREYQQTGNRYVFAFYHQHPYQAEVVEDIPVSDEVVVEVHGHFDSYFINPAGERVGVVTAVDPDEAQPVIYGIGAVRVRMQFNEKNEWVMTGFHEQIRGVECGYSCD